MRKFFVFLGLVAILVMVQGSLQAQTSKIYIGSVSNTYPAGDLTDTVLIAGENHELVIWWDGTGLTGSFLTTNNWLIHGTADWHTIQSLRAGLVLRQFIENGTLSFNVTPVHMGWHKVGGSGDPNFGNPGFAIKEPASPPVLPAGPYGSNGTGTDTVGIQLALVASGLFGWEPAVNPVGSVLVVSFSTDVADHLNTICIDTASSPLGAWVWAQIGGVNVYPDWDNGLGNSDTRCWIVADTSLMAVSPRDNSSLPTSFDLGQNYPNPFNPTTNIHFDIPVRTHAKIMVYNVLGQKVRSLVNQEFTPGSYEVDWDGTSDGGEQVASGIYFYRLTADDVVKTKKMMVLK